VDYGVRFVLDGAGLEPYMVPVLESGDYELVIVDERLESALRIAEATATINPSAVLVNPARGAQATIDAVTEATGWRVGGRSIFVVVVSAKGGVGKTTTAGAVVALLADEGHSVLAVDDNPHQGNLVRFLTERQVPVLSGEDIAAGALEGNTVRVEARIDLVAPGTYAERGVTFGTSKRFWKKVRQQSYDYIVVDTSPAIPMPQTPDEWTEIYVSYALLTGALPAVYVAPFTPVEWGRDGIERTRDVLKRWGQLDWMLPVVTATDRDHVLEHVPSWLEQDGWRNRLVAIPYCRGIQTQPRMSYLRRRSLFRRPTRPYRPLVQKVMLLADRRQEQTVRESKALH
jgi:hypothetical protein